MDILAQKLEPVSKYPQISMDPSFP